MSRQLPVPLRPRQSQAERTRRQAAVRPEVIEVNPKRRGESARQAHPLARLAVSLAPDVLRAVERSLDRRIEAQRPQRLIPPSTSHRSRASGFRVSEIEYDLTTPFVRKVTVRRASGWMTDTPLIPTPQSAPRGGGRLRRAGLVGAGAVTVAALGLIVNRAATLPGIGRRR